MTIAIVLLGLVVLLLTGVPVFAGLGLASIVLMIATEGSIGSVVSVTPTPANSAAPSSSSWRTALRSPADQEVMAGRVGNRQRHA